MQFGRIRHTFSSCGLPVRVSETCVWDLNSGGIPRHETTGLGSLFRWHYIKATVTGIKIAQGSSSDESNTLEKTPWAYL